MPTPVNNLVTAIDEPPRPDGPNLAATMAATPNFDPSFGPDIVF
jgi:hypothetical protein